MTFLKALEGKLTKAHSERDDNNGNCELCQRDDGGKQSTVPVMLGGGLGMGTMWMCRRCIKEKGGRAAIELEAENDRKGIPRLPTKP